MEILYSKKIFRRKLSPLIFNFLLLLNTIYSTPVTSSPNLDNLYTKVSRDVQTTAAQEVVERLLPKRYSEFVIQVDPDLSGSLLKDAFSVEYDTEVDKVVIKGTTGVSALFGFNQYLKYDCNCHVSWEGNQLQLPNTLPKVSMKQNIIDRFRYYQNVVTDSYSFVWWNWAKWEKHIDWMALNGVNLPLAFTGQEAIWQRVYLAIGLSPEDVSDYISGPAFLAWWRMGNIQKWGGPIPQSFVNKKLHLLHRILHRMRCLGMLPVLPGFSGNVPPTLKKIYPNATLIEHPAWNRFNKTYATYMLEPTDPVFLTIGKRFMKELLSEVGTDHVYSCDTFNENRPRRSDPGFLKDVANSTYVAMHIIDNNAVWMMQSWVFRDPNFWGEEQVKGYLSGVETGNAIILDLEAERNPLYLRFKSFYGHGFLWCMLHNFGGTMSLFGSFSAVNNGVAEARRNVTDGSLLGTGVCPEGIHQNYIMYDFMQEMSLASSALDIDKWVQSYARRRYGENNDFLLEAWEILQNSIYNAPAQTQNSGKSVITRRPSMKLTEPMWFDLDDIRSALERFINAVYPSVSLYNSSLYKHDLVDVTREFLQIMGSEVYKSIVQAYTSRKFKKFQKSSHQLLEMLDDLDIILGTSSEFLLGRWVKDSEAWVEGLQEKRLLRYNALNQITLWGPTDEIADYAAKQWSGVVSDYYKPRWTSFITALNASLTSGKPFNGKAFRADVLTSVEKPFTLSARNYPTEARGDSIKEATRIFRKWSKLCKKFVRRNARQQQLNVEDNDPTQL